MPGVVTAIARVQAVALVGLALAVVVLTLTSSTSLPVAFTVSEVVIALLGAALLGVAPVHPRARTPIFLLEVIAVGVSVQLTIDGRPGVALLVGLPALVMAVLILLVVREAGLSDRADDAD